MRWAAWLKVLLLWGAALSASQARGFGGQTCLAKRQPSHALLAKRGGGGFNASWASLLVKGIGSFLRRSLSIFLPKGSFIESFEQEFGKEHPAFLDAPTLTQAANAARLSGKFLLVYLPSGSPREEKRHQAFCRTLADAKVIKKLEADFIMWVPTADSAPLRAAARELKAKRVPFLGVVHMGQKTKKVALRSVHHFKPPPTPQQTITWISKTLEIHGHFLEEDRRDMAHAIKEANLLKEQEQEFAKALKADKGRIERERREAKEKAAREAAERKKAAEDAARREKKSAELGEEPQGKDACRIMVKLPDGQRVQRAFAPGDRMERVFDWLDVEGQDLATVKLVRNRPRAVFSYPESSDGTVGDAGLAGQVLLFMEPR